MLRSAAVASIAAVLLTSAGSARSSSPPTPRGLVFYNTLASGYDVTHTVVGPNLSLFNCRDRRAPHFGRRCSIDVPGTLAFAPGPSGLSAATIGGGPYFAEARVHTAELRRSILNPEHGATDAWYLQKKDPEPFVDNPTGSSPAATTSAVQAT